MIFPFPMWSCVQLVRHQRLYWKRDPFSCSILFAVGRSSYQSFLRFRGLRPARFVRGPGFSTSFSPSYPLDHFKTGESSRTSWGEWIDHQHPATDWPRGVPIGCKPTCLMFALTYTCFAGDAFHSSCGAVQRPARISRGVVHCSWARKAGAWGPGGASLNGGQSLKSVQRDWWGWWDWWVYTVMRLMYAPVVSQRFFSWCNRRDWQHRLISWARCWDSSKGRFPIVETGRETSALPRNVSNLHFIHISFFWDLHVLTSPKA